MRGLIVIAAMLLLAAEAGASERGARTEIDWSGSLPRVPKEGEEEPEADSRPRRPLLVYVFREIETRDQSRFEDVALKNETFRITTKFFDCVRVSETTAAAHPLLKDLRIKAPAVVVFESTLTKHVVAGGRASGMKIYGVMCQVGQLDYKTNIGKTVRAGRNLLATFDQVDAARYAIGVKGERVAEAQGKGDTKKVRQLEREMEKQRAENEALYEKAEKRWQEIWTLERKER